jgi:hypothetical protein
MWSPQGHRRRIVGAGLAAPTPLNGKAFDNRDRILGRWSSGGEGHLFSVAIRFSPVGDQPVSGSGRMGSGPNVVGIDLQNCGEGAATPPL